MIGALFRLVFGNLLGNLWILVANLPRLVRRRPRWVRIRLADPLPARPPARRWFRRRVPSLAGLADFLDELAKDPKLVGLVVEVEHVHGSWATLTGLRALLEGFRSKGKQLVCHLSSPTLGAYYVATAADRIACDESGPLALVGIAAEVTFYGGALEKFGARAELEHRGKYKSFAETFTRKDMSPAHREALDAILDQIESNLGQSLNRRGVDQAVLAGGPYTAAEAAAKKLIDAVKYRDELDAWIGAKSGSAAAWRGGRLRRLRWRPLFRGPRVAVLPLHGAIVNGEGGGRTVGSDSAARAIAAAREDRRVAALVLHIDSRGGSASASDLIWREVSLTVKKKPVVACLADVAASGGYYIACAASKIVAQPLTLTGSIGVVAGKLNLGGVMEKLGLNAVILARGDAAAMNSSARGYSDEERRRLVVEIDALYDQFVRKVAAGRQLSALAADQIAQGRVWTGADAHARKLVDELGDARAAIRIARELAGRGELPVEERAVHPRRQGLLRLALGRSARGGLRYLAPRIRLTT
jgi:protease-4